MIVLVRTPLRVSLFGGGTDYPAYFHRAPGAVLGFAIDKYVYISALPLSAAVDYRYRLSYSQVEHVDRIEEIRHRVVNTVLRYYGWDRPTDFSAQADLPAGVGLGSSSAFTVGMINLVSHMMGVPRTRFELAREAIHTEQALLREAVGVQDQLHASFGGINRFDLAGDGFRITPIDVSGRDLALMTDWMVLVYTGIRRRASSVLDEQVANLGSRSTDGELRELADMVDEAQQILEDRERFDEAPARIAILLDRAWALKRRLSAGVSGPLIDDLYDFCRRSGALAGKLCGAGGGGFLLMIVPPERRAAFENAVGQRRCVRFAIDLQGSAVIAGLPS